MRTSLLGTVVMGSWLVSVSVHRSCYNSSLNKKGVAEEYGVWNASKGKWYLRSTERSSNRVMHKNLRPVNLSMYSSWTPIWPPQKILQGQNSSNFSRGEWRHFTLCCIVIKHSVTKHHGISFDYIITAENMIYVKTFVVK